jgi:hypothetical protein
MPVAALALTAAIGAAELKRASIGWMEPDPGSVTDTLFTLRENYYPGDVGFFDPPGLKPTDAVLRKFKRRELQERKTGFGVAGMCSQELVNHKTIDRGKPLSFIKM